MKRRVAILAVAVSFFGFGIAPAALAGENHPQRASAAPLAHPRLTLLSSRQGALTNTAAESRQRPTAHLGLSPATLSYLGGHVVLTVSASHAARCLLASSPKFWSGSNPLRVHCKARYSLGTLRAATATHRWTFTLTARARSGRVARSRRTLTLKGPPFQLSGNWSGYVVPSSSPVTAMSGNFTVPTLNCAKTPNAGVSAWVGIGGWGASSGDLLQTGVRSGCTAGAQYNDVGWWEEYPQYSEVDFSGMSLAPGDQIAASVYQLSDGSWVTRADDLRTGVSGVMHTGVAWGLVLDSNPSAWYAREGNASTVYYAGGTTAEWIVERFSLASGGQVQLADFGTIAFTNTRTSLPSWSLSADEAVGTSDGRYLLSAPSVPQGSGFSVLYTG